MSAEREYAAKQLLRFLDLVGPVEAIWAMTTAAAALKDLPSGADYQAAAARALAAAQAEAAEAAAIASVAPSAGALDAFVIGDAPGIDPADVPDADPSDSEKPSRKKASGH